MLAAALLLPYIRAKDSLGSGKLEPSAPSDDFARPQHNTLPCPGRTSQCPRTCPRTPTASRRLTPDCLLFFPSRNCTLSRTEYRIETPPHLRAPTVGHPPPSFPKEDIRVCQCKSYRTREKCVASLMPSCRSASVTAPPRRRLTASRRTHASKASPRSPEVDAATSCFYTTTPTCRIPTHHKHAPRSTTATAALHGSQTITTTVVASRNERVATNRRGL